MKRAFLFGLVAVAGAAFTPAANAQLAIDIEDAIVDSSAGQFDGFLEVFFSSATAANEGLAGFSVRVDLTGGSAGGVQFVPPPVTTTTHPWVFAPAAQPVSLVNFMSDFDTIQATADAALGNDQNIDTNEGIVRIQFRVPQGTALGIYPVTLNVTSFFSDAAGEEIAFVATPGTITVTPEPAALSLLALAAAGLGIRHRRRA